MSDDNLNCIRDEDDSKLKTVGSDKFYGSLPCKKLTLNEMERGQNGNGENESKWASLRKLLSTAFPIILSYQLQASNNLITSYFLAHKDITMLNISSISLTFANLTGYVIILGLSTVLDSLGSSTFHSKDRNQKLKLGLQLQRVFLCGLASILPSVILWWNCSYVLDFWFEESWLIRDCEVYLRVLSLGLPAYLGFECLKKFLQAQGKKHKENLLNIELEIMFATTFILCFSVPLNFGLHHLLLSNPKTEIGLLGAPLATVITQWTMLFLLILYTLLVNGKQGWDGFSRLAFKGWYNIFKLGVPGVIMVGSDYFGFEIMLIAASRLGSIPLAVHAILVGLSNLIYMSYHGLGVASSNLMGTYLARKQPILAKRLTISGYTLALTLSTTFGATLLVFAKRIAHFYTNNQQVATILIQMLPILALNQVLDSLATVNTGLLRGQGRQLVAAKSNLIGFYFIGIPIGFLLTFSYQLQLFGLWFGLTAALATVALSLTYYTFNTSWNEQIKLCKLRISDN